MSLKNYIFSSVNIKGVQDSDKFATIRIRSPKSARMTGITEEQRDTTVSELAQTAAAADHIAQEDGTDRKTRLKRLAQFWKYISVEPIMLCWLLPSCFLFIAIENLALEKVRLRR